MANKLGHACLVRQPAILSIAERFVNLCPTKDDTSHTGCVPLRAILQWHRQRSQHSQCPRDLSIAEAIPATQPEIQKLAPYRTAWFRHAGCHRARCWGGKLSSGPPAATAESCARKIS